MRNFCNGPFLDNSLRFERSLLLPDSTIVSLSGGAMIANVISVMLLMIETAMMRH